MRHPIGRQSGATLLVVLIMLVLLTLFAVSALNTSSLNLRVVGNAQAKSEAFKATQQAIETVISSATFTTTPSDAVVLPCGAPNTICTDLNGKATASSAEYTTKLTPAPACVAVQPLKLEDLNIDTPESPDVSCAAGVNSSSAGVQGANTGDSLCVNAVWEITASTTAANSGSTVTHVQGVGVRMDKDNAQTVCG